MDKLPERYDFGGFVLEIDRKYETILISEYESDGDMLEIDYLTFEQMCRVFDLWMLENRSGQK